MNAFNYCPGYCTNHLPTVLYNDKRLISSTNHCAYFRRHYALRLAQRWNQETWKQVEAGEKEKHLRTLFQKKFNFACIPLWCLTTMISFSKSHNKEDIVASNTPKQKVYAIRSQLYSHLFLVHFTLQHSN